MSPSLPLLLWESRLSVRRTRQRPLADLSVAFCGTPTADSSRDDVVSTAQQYTRWPLPYPGLGTGIARCRQQPGTGIFLSLPSAMLYILLFLLNGRLLAFLLIVPLVSACWLWFSVNKQRYLWNQKSIPGAHFHFTVTASSPPLLRLQNILLLMSSVGLAWP